MRSIRALSPTAAPMPSSSRAAKLRAGSSRGGTHTPQGAHAFQNAKGRGGTNTPPRYQAFDDGDASMRYERVREALSVTGVSIVSGSLSTLLATFPMFFTQITFFSKFGTVMFMTM